MLIFKKLGRIFFFFFFPLSTGVRETGICLVTGECPPTAESRASGEIATTLGARPQDTDHSETDHATQRSGKAYGLSYQVPSS